MYPKIRDKIFFKGNFLNAMWNPALDHVPEKGHYEIQLKSEI